MIPPPLPRANGIRASATRSIRPPAISGRATVAAAVFFALLATGCGSDRSDEVNLSFVRANDTTTFFDPDSEVAAVCTTSEDGSPLLRVELGRLDRGARESGLLLHVGTGIEKPAAELELDAGEQLRREASVTLFDAGERRRYNSEFGPVPGTLTFTEMPCTGEDSVGKTVAFAIDAQLPTKAEFGPLIVTLAGTVRATISSTGEG